MELGRGTWSAHTLSLPLTGVMMPLVRVFEDHDIDTTTSDPGAGVVLRVDHIWMMLVYYI